MKTFSIIIALLTLNACGTVVARQCVTFKPNTVTARYEKIKKIATEEAGNYGLPRLSTEVKPTKFNDYDGKLIFKGNGADTLNLEINHDIICFHGGGMAAQPKTAIAAMLERYKDLLK